MEVNAEFAAGELRCQNPPSVADFDTPSMVIFRRIRGILSINPMIHEAYCKLQAMSEDEANRMIYEARLKAQRDDYSRMNGALQKGLREGIQKGHEEDREEGELNATKRIVLEMGKQGLDIKTIAVVMQVSEQQINDILKEKI